MSEKEQQEKPNHPGHNGQEEMEQLFELAKKKKVHVGVFVRPKRTPDELKDDKDPANLVVVLANYRPLDENIIASDEVTESLAVSAKFLLEELKHG